MQETMPDRPDADIPDAIDLVSAALVAAQAEFRNVPKSGYNRQGNYHYATAEDWLDMGREILAKHDLAILTSTVGALTLESREARSGGTWFRVRVKMEGRLLHASGQWLPLVAYGDGEDPTDKAIYKAQTGAFKYLIRGIFNVATSDDPERDDDAGGGKNAGADRTGGRGGSASGARPNPSRPTPPAPEPARKPRPTHSPAGGRPVEPLWLDDTIPLGKFKGRTWRYMTEGDPDGQRLSWLEWASKNIEDKRKGGAGERARKTLDYLREKIRLEDAPEREPGEDDPDDAPDEPNWDEEEPPVPTDEELPF